MTKRKPTAPTLSVCVVSFNTRDLLWDCLTSVYAETAELGRSGFEVIVVDNASTDGSPEMVAETFPETRLIRNRENRRFAAGCNQAMDAARGEVLLLLNSDTVIRDGALVKMVAFMASRFDVGALGCRLVHPDGTPVRSFGIFPSIGRTVAFSSWLTRRMIHAPLYRSDGVLSRGVDAPVEVDYPSGACLMTRRRAADEVGSLDERFWFYGEEMDYCWRLRRRGWRSMLLPVDVVHIGGASTHLPVPEMLKRCVMADWHFVTKHRSLPYWVLFLACELTSIAWRWTTMPVKRLLGRITSRQADETRRTIRRVLSGLFAGDYRGRSDAHAVGLSPKGTVPSAARPLGGDSPLRGQSQ